MERTKVKGIILVLSGSGLWGISGTVAQYLFEQQGVSPEWLVTIRLLIVGASLILFSATQLGGGVVHIFANRQDRRSLLLYSIFGMLAIQYTYYAAIEASNAATATILQFLGPVLITGYLAVRSRRLPTSRETLAIVLALTGTFLLVTHGDIGSLSISVPALLWGLGTAVAFALYTLMPRALLAKWGVVQVVGWAMLIAGIGFSFIHAPWDYDGKYEMGALIAILFVIVFGTLIAFLCYLQSLRYLSAVETGLLSSIEPVAATLLAVFWLQTMYKPMDWIGTLCIVLTIVVLSGFSLSKARKARRKHRILPKKQPWQGA